MIYSRLRLTCEGVYSPCGLSEGLLLCVSIFDATPTWICVHCRTAMQQNGVGYLVLGSAEPHALRTDSDSL